MSDTTTPSASEPIGFPPITPQPAPAAAQPVNPYVSAPVAAPPANPYVAPAPQPASPVATPAYQPVPTSPPPAALTPYSTTGAAYAYAPRTNPAAIASLVLSLVGLVTWITAIGGIISGHIALSQIKRTGEGGRGMALAGLIVGYVLTGFLVLYLVFIVAMIVGISTYSYP